MSDEQCEDEALVLAAAAFAGDRADALLGGLADERAVRCRARLRVLQEGAGDARRRRMAAELRRLFAPAAVALAGPDLAQLADRLALERPAVQALIVGDLPGSTAAELAALLKLAPTRAAAPDPPLRAWLRRFLLDGAA